MKNEVVDVFQSSNEKAWSFLFGNQDVPFLLKQVIPESRKYPMYRFWFTIAEESRKYLKIKFK